MITVFLFNKQFLSPYTVIHLLSYMDLFTYRMWVELKTFLFRNFLQLQDGPTMRTSKPFFLAPQLNTQVSYYVYFAYFLDPEAEVTTTALYYTMYRQQVGRYLYILYLQPVFKLLVHIILFYLYCNVPLYTGGVHTLRLVIIIHLIILLSIRYIIMRWEYGSVSNKYRSDSRGVP